jgi:hypothetical protein
MDKRLLVFDCHEAWVFQLRVLPYLMDVVIGLRGRHTDGWDQAMRPVPPNARLVRSEQIPQIDEPYDCIVASNLSDLLDARSLAGPRLLVLHETLDGAAREQGLNTSVDEFRNAVARFVTLTRTHVMAVSKLKGRSWGFESDIVPCSAEPSDYLPWQGDIAAGLRVSNHIARRPRILLWEFHRQAFEGLPVTIVGHNDGLEGAGPAANWEDLKKIFSRHRFYIHTADPDLEDGYNMATLEAMAAGLPVLGNPHPTSPIEHGVSGFLSDDPGELRCYARRLLADRNLAARMGQAARQTVTERFSSAQFKSGFIRSVESARQKWRQSESRAASGNVPSETATLLS